MKSSHSKRVGNLINKALLSGLFWNKETTIGGILYPHDKTMPPLAWHRSDRGFHPTRRYLKKFGINP
jgi:hypothetical protein